MANFDLYFPKEIQLEGDKYEVVPGDTAGCTKYGLTIFDIQEYHIDLNSDGKFDCNDVKLIDRATASKILKKLYWDYFKADDIPEQSVAEFIVDGGLNQGRVLIVKYLQHLLGVTVDGHFGPVTFKILLDRIKIDSGKATFNQLYQQRFDRYKAIVANNPSQGKFMLGWTNRLNAIKYS